jgi:hypothetical protein
MDYADAAWLAGLFEGEGNIHIAKNGGTRLTIRMTDLDVIQRVDRLVPCTRIHVVHPPGARTQYAWRLSDPDKIKALLAAIMPWLGTRRREAAERLLDHLATRPGTGGHHRSKTHCAQGHEYTPENTYIRPGTTHRHCRTCRAVWAKASVALKRAADASDRPPAMSR